MSLSRRHLLLAAPALVGLSGCKILDRTFREDGQVERVLSAANGLTYRAQRLISGGRTLAPEYTEADIRQGQRPNGSTDPQNADYRALAQTGFADWRLTVGGLVETPLALSLDQIRAMPARTQITRHDCVEGWSCIAKWTGTPLSAVLDRARPTAEARFVLFRCLDVIERGLSGEVRYYETIDLVDATHPQTILAYGLNDAALPVANGAPLRVRVERQLGYKMAKYVTGIDLVAGFGDLGLGKGGYWEDRGYDWYAGI